MHCSITCLWFYWMKLCRMAVTRWTTATHLYAQNSIEFDLL